MQTRLMHKSQRSVICGFIFLIWASGNFMFWRGYICRTPISRRARMLFWAYRKLKPHLYYRKNGSGPIKKLVWTRYFCCVNLLYHVFMKWIQTRFFLVLGPQKKTTPDPFCCSKAVCKCIFVQCYLLHVSLPCSTVVLHMCTIALFNHKPNLIVTSVNV